MERMTIIGLGLIGGSLGLALKATKLPNVEIVGYDTDTIAAVDARRLGAVDKTEHTLQRATADAGMVILATPIVAMRQVMEEIARGLRENCIVTDTASTKSLVMEWAGELLPPHVSFVGGHPMAGKETAGIANADAKLFAGKAYCIVPSPDATESAVKLVAGLVHLIGAQPLFIDAHEHDRYVAAVSHLPLVLSSALFTLVREQPRLARAGGPGQQRLSRPHPPGLRRPGAEPRHLPHQSRGHPPLAGTDGGGARALPRASGGRARRKSCSSTSPEPSSTATPTSPPGRPPARGWPPTCPTPANSWCPFSWASGWCAAPASYASC